MSEDSNNIEASVIPPLPQPRIVDCTTGGDLGPALQAAKEVIAGGHCLVMPTDTVYGICADAFDAHAVQRLLTAKHRGRDMPPPVLISDDGVMSALAREVPEAAQRLVAVHWPGPLTIICKAQPSLRMDLGETRGTIAIRVPDHDLARDILRRTGPMAVSSANVSGQPSATNVRDAADQLGLDVALYLDGGPTPGPVPSTIVDFTVEPEGRVVREGILTLAVLRETAPGVLGALETEVPAAEPEPTGQSVAAEKSVAAERPVAPADQEPAGTEVPVEETGPATVDGERDAR
ncbi:L-threonylcarbamoyladenylate synthase [Raineyella antarctica]|nr:L-threonylcarbamoyladenylate synthase [Raineyella antarctica]